MTLDEKIGQLTQIGPHFFLHDLNHELTGPVTELGISEEKIYLTGSILGIGNAREMKKIQEKYLAKSRHKIPLLFMADVVHGYETIFPVPLALSTSWDEDILFDSARVAAIEAQTAGINVTFAPMSDLSRDPRWGRVVEGFGEDPLLNEKFTQAMVRGFQNGDISQEGNLASCVKHFAAYGAAEAGRDYNTVDMSKRILHQHYLPGYKAGVDAGAKLMMTAFNVFDGVPATTNSYLLKDVLRNSWQFKGVVISDYASLKETIKHGTSENGYDAAVQGIQAGLDIEMATALYMQNLRKAVEAGDVDVQLIDEAVLRVLMLKKELGLFENPYKGMDLEKEKTLVLSDNHKMRAKKAADASIVLLKNENSILPLKNQKIALIGPYATSQAMMGPWSWHGKPENSRSIQSVLEEKAKVVYTNSAKNSQEIHAADYDKIKTADVIVLALGEAANHSGEAHSRSVIDLPKNQKSLIETFQKLGKPIVLILFNGRPLKLTDVEPQVDAIIEAFFPGTMAAESIVDILMGRVNPSAKLTMSFPRNEGQIPIYYNHLNTGRPFADAKDAYTSHYLDVENEPLYPFGYGLSYAQFNYQNLKLSKNHLKPNEIIVVSVDIKNDSDVAGFEIVQFYIRDHVAKVSRPVKELKQYQKIWFNPKEEKKVTFDVTINDLTYISNALETVYDTGRFSVFVGTNSISCLEAQFQLEKE